MSFAQHLQLVLDPALPLPLHIDLGERSCSWENGKLKVNYDQNPEGFRQLRRDELMQLMRRLQASPHVILLNLWGHEIDAATMREMAAPIAALSDLQALVLVGTCPPPPAATAAALLPLHPSHIADNDLGDEGRIALSSSLVHLSHLKVLSLYGKCFWIQRVVVVVLLSAAEFAFVALSRACFTRFCLILILISVSCLIGAATAAPPSPSLTHFRERHRRRRVHRALVMFGSSFSFESTESRR